MKGGEMKDWKLTLEEIERLREGYGIIAYSTVWFAKEIAEAAQRKLVEWQENPCLEHWDIKLPILHKDCRFCAKALRRELGLEEK
jgi:hypothetical protein